MRVSKGLTLAILGALVVGGAEAVGEMAVANVAQSDRSPTVVDVPTGRIGDEAVYQTFRRSTPDEPWQAAKPFSFRVAGVEQAGDETGQLHDVLNVAEDSGNYTYVGGLLQKEMREDYNWTIVSSYSLATRHLIRYHTNENDVSTVLFGVPAARRYTALFHGPLRSQVPIGAGPAYIVWENGLHQGSTYAPGDDASDWAWHRVTSDLALFTYAGLVVSNVTATGRVGNPAFVGERLALPIHASACFDWAKPEPSSWHRIGLLYGSVPVPSHTCVEHVEWVSSAAAYPLRTETRFLINGTQRQESMSTLVQLRSGTRTIPWTLLAETTPYRASDPSTERSPTGLQYPADGAMHGLSFPLAQALAASKNDPTLIRFAAWRAQHGDAKLVGYMLQPFGPDLDGRRWSLVYGSASGVGFVVQVERVRPSAPVSAMEIGEFNLKGFRPADLPDDPVTIGAAHRLWTGFGLAHGRLEPNFVRWGYAYWRETLYCPQAQRCTTIPAGIYPFSWGLGAIIYGHNAQADADTRVEVSAPGDASNYTLIVVRTRTGNTPTSLDYRREHEARAGLPALLPHEPPPGPGVAAPHDVQAVQPDFGRSAFVAASLLALVLVGYFWPLLKVAGAHALTILPGYAKTARPRILENRVRDALVQAIRVDPGITAPSLQKIVGTGWTTTIYHLRLLEKSGLLSSLVDGRHRRYFPTDTVHASDRGRIAAIKHPRSRALYEIILDEPGIGRDDLAQRAGISRPATYWHIERLERAGFVGQERDGRRVRFYPAATSAPVADAPGSEAMEVA